MKIDEVHIDVLKYQEHDQATAAMPRDQKSLTVGIWGSVRPGRVVTAGQGTACLARLGRAGRLI